MTQIYAGFKFVRSPYAIRQSPRRHRRERTEAQTKNRCRCCVDPTPLLLPPPPEKMFAAFVARIARLAAPVAVDCGEIEEWFRINS